MVYVSCGFDAGEHEYESMSRHNRRVPTTFYNRFARDATAFADVHALGRVVGVLEGGYSDRALIAGGMAWTAGMIGEADRSWWSVQNLEKLESTMPSTKRKPRASAPTSSYTAAISESWVSRALSLIPTLDATVGIIHAPVPRARKKPDPVPARMALRDRNKKGPESTEAQQPTQSMPRSPPKTVKPVSKTKSVKPQSVGALPQPPVANPLTEATSIEAGGEVSGFAEQAQEADSAVDAATSALQTLSLGQPSQDQSATQSNQDKGPLIIKLRRSKAPQVD
ncbi:hypothetical protein FRC09_019427 [Ceratobasidium sp. 395]|nr:hypothetical protein FRC09_019427 [Ceratobasidium sp. 395]